jgi:rubrerythrin
MQRTPQDEPRPRGALEDLTRDPSSRKRFFKATGTGAVGAFALFLAACGSSKKSTTGATGAQQPAPSTKATGTEMFGKGDLGILGYALTLEYLETDFYAQAAKSGKLSGKALAVAKQFGSEEAQHVAALESAIKKSGGKLPAKPKGKFPLKDQASILKLAASVENLGAGAYLGQAGNIKSPEVLVAALSIHTIEARHASVLNEVVGMDITPDGAFAKPIPASQVLAMVKPFIA